MNGVWCGSDSGATGWLLPYRMTCTASRSRCTATPQTFRCIAVANRCYWDALKQQTQEKTYYDRYTANVNKDSGGKNSTSDKEIIIAEDFLMSMTCIRYRQIQVNYLFRHSMRNMTVFKAVVTCQVKISFQHDLMQHTTYPKKHTFEKISVGKRLTG